VAKKRKGERQPRLKLQPTGELTTPPPTAVEEVLEELEPRQKQVIQEWISYAFSGPLPPPNIVSGYDQIITNGADRIMEMAERDQEHVHGLENAHSARLDRFLDSDIRLARNAQLLGGVLFTLMIVAALLFAFLDKLPVALGTVLSAGLVQVGTWLLNRYSNRQPTKPEQDKAEPKGK
jgi:uncharacterized membrane protein